MDFVKREDENLIDAESYKAYTETVQKQSHHLDMGDYQHTAISMEQLHQAMHSSLNAGNLAHNFQIPLSPRQMSTLMLKTNHLARNLHFNEIPAHLTRNLSDIELQNLANEVNISQLTQNLARNHDEIVTHSLGRNLNGSIVRNLSNEMELQDIAIAQSLAQTLNDQIDLSRNLAMELTQRNDLQANQNHAHEEINHNINRELDLSHHNRNINEQEILEESRRTPLVQCVSENVLDQTIGQRLVNTVSVHETATRPINASDSMLPLPFQIKSEQQDEGFFYDSLNQGYGSNINTLPAHIPLNPDQNQPNQVSLQQDSQIYTSYNQQYNISALAPIDLYTRPQNYVQNYVENLNRDNPQNLVMHRQFENHSPYPQEEYKVIRQNSNVQEISKSEQPKENLKPAENKIFYSGYSENTQTYSSEKNENDSSEHNKMTSDDLSMNIKGEYVCFKCNGIYPTKRGLKQHTKICTENGDSTEKVGKFSCSQCAYRCQSPAILKIHERTHTGEKPFSCTFCDYKSGQKNNVAKHILVHMKEKPFRCQYCEYRCAQKNNLVVHERTHTGYKPFACPYCEYRTVQKPNLVKHMYLHTDQKPFSCDMCTYRCVQKTNLTKHKQRHMNDKDGENSEFKNQAKPYRPRQKSVKCTHCTYRCVQKSSLDKHMQFKHSDTNQISNADFAQESFEKGLNLMKSTVENCEETIQNLSLKKTEQLFNESVCQDKIIEPLQS